VNTRTFIEVKRVWKNYYTVEAYSEPDSIISIVAGYELGSQGSILTKVEDFSCILCTEPALGPTQPPVQ
jgi:hypothetical protein